MPTKPWGALFDEGTDAFLGIGSFGTDILGIRLKF
jgi:hypothetical protein